MGLLQSCRDQARARGHRAGGCPAWPVSVSATLGRATALPGTSFLSQKKKGLSKMITRVFHRTVLLRSCGQSCYANSPPPPSWGKRNEPVSAVFLQDRSFRESLASTFFFPFDEINYEHCPGSFDSGDTCQDKIFQKHLYLII
jgi:hypothetical protein